ncbi:MAG: BspA family leucine-rich repeat surface protein [Lachnospiraceae bacterium]|nr:BspA family leucine-rich repeat surface protein [Lachnospiraceae bacterium]
MERSAINGIYSWSLDENGNATLRDGEGEIPFNYIDSSEYCDLVKSIDVDAEWLPASESLFISLRNLETAKIKAGKTYGDSLGYMFCGCDKLRSADLSGLNTASIKDFTSMFISCYSLTEVNLSGWNTKNVESMNGMFALCRNLASIDLSSFDTSNVTNMSYMFSGCNNLKNLDLSSFDMGKVTEAYVFLGIGYENAFQIIRTPKNLSLDCGLPGIDGVWRNERTGEYEGCLPKNAANSQTLVIQLNEWDGNLSIAKKSLTLYDIITIDFKVDKKVMDDYRNLYLVAEQDGDKTKITNYTVKGDDVIFSYRVVPQAMNEYVLAAVCGDNAEVCLNWQASFLYAFHILTDEVCFTII